MTRIAIMGASGRMGRMLISSVMSNPQATLSHAFVRAESNLIGVDAGELVGLSTAGIMLGQLSADALRKVDVLIDFSLPEALADVVQACRASGTALVVGVTGLDADAELLLKQASQDIAIVYAGNYSLGVNLSLNLVATTAKALGDEADIEIVETHHKHKLDAPSGTALMLGNAAAHARGQVLQEVMVNGRAGQAKRQSGEIGIHAVRGGEVVGEHRVSFIMNGEIIELTHRATSRMTFADGAVRAALWLSTQSVGLYDMQDVLGLKA